MSDFVPDDRLSPVPHVEFRPTKEGGVVVDLNTGTYFGLNRVAADVWVRLTAGESLRTIIDSLHQRYEIDRHVLTRDTLRLCTELTAAKLLRPA